VRVVRSVLGVLLALVGLIVGLAGAAAAFWVIGPDDTVRSDVQHLNSKGLAIASAPDLLDRHGPVLHVDATAADGKPVFVGVARDLDVASYLKSSSYTRLVQVKYPIALDTEARKGGSQPLAAPDSLDWWVARSTGAGTQSIAWPIADGPYDVVIMKADGRPGADVQVHLGIEIPHAFTTALGVLVLGLLLLAGGLLLILVRRRPAAPGPLVTASDHRSPEVKATVGPLRRVAVATTVVALVSGCAAVPEANTVDSLTRPAVTTESGVSVVKHYNQVNNAANRRRDDKLLATVEGGDLLRESRAGYTIERALKQKPTAPFSYTNPVIAAPEYGSYPMRFVMSSGLSSGKDYRSLGLWERAAAGSPWIHTFSVGPKATTKIPDLTGLRAAVPGDNAKLAVAPQAAATALAQYLTAGAKSPRAALFAPDQAITGLLKDVAADKAMVVKQPAAYHDVTADFSVDTPPATFVTKSGQALVLATLTDQLRLTIGPGYTFEWNSGHETAFSAGGKYTNYLSRTRLHDVALVVPAKGGGKIRVLALDTQVVDAGGY